MDSKRSEEQLTAKCWRLSYGQTKENELCQLLIKYDQEYDETLELISWQKEKEKLMRNGSYVLMFGTVANFMLRCSPQFQTYSMYYRAPLRASLFVAPIVFLKREIFQNLQNLYAISVIKDSHILPSNKELPTIQLERS